MTIAPSQNPIGSDTQESVQSAGQALYPLPDEYSDIRADTETQFEQLDLNPKQPTEPSWLERWLGGVLEWLGDALSPVGAALASGWPIIQWVLIISLAAFALYVIARLVLPVLKNPPASATTAPTVTEWRPEQTESLALLEDADKLAAQGQYDEAARLLLKRSVSQIATAKPEWVEPSSTARELAALPALPEGAKRAFGVMSAAVESSLFALRALSKDDWNAARQAYADFALVRLDGDGARA